jgi:hypothetical protein
MAEEQDAKQALIAAAKTLPPTEVFSLRPRTFEEAFRFANLIAESTLIPKEFQKSPANVLIAVQLGMELGVSPMQALQNIYVVNGRPAIFGDLLPAIVMASGLLEEFEETGDDKEAQCTVKRKGLKAITRKFTIAEAQRAGLLDRGDVWKKYPQRMLQMRARAFAMRDMFADVLKGVAIKEELEDIEPRDVTPIKAPQALPKEKQDENAATPDRDAKSEELAPTKAPDARAKAAPAPKAANPVENPAAISQEDIIQELLLWIENAPIEELNKEPNWCLQQLKLVKGTDAQLRVLRPFNARRQAQAKA